ncbi:MAG TPA: hypothetical protein VIQ31_24440 [Phormidium sp.]
MGLPKKIDLRIHETYTLILPGLGTTGVVRSYEVIQTSQVVDVFDGSHIYDDEDLEEPKPGEAKLMITGARKDAVFKIRGLRPGHSMIQFFQQHVGKGSERQKEHLLEVNVKG